MADRSKVKATKVSDNDNACQNLNESAIEDNEEINSDNNQKQLSHLATSKSALNISAHDEHVSSVARGYVADRIEQINSNPGTPTNSSKMPKVKSSMKNSTKTATKMRTLVAKDGQLGLQHMVNQSTEENVSMTNLPNPNGLQAGGQHDETNPISDLTSILRELSNTVKKLEAQLDKMDKNQQSAEEKVSKLEVVQQQDSMRLRGIMDQIDEHDDKIDALIGIVVRQDQQIQALTNQMNSAYAAKNYKNIIINGMPETQGENCIHEVAHFVKHVLKVDKHIPLKFARRLGRGPNKPMLVKVLHPADKSVFFQNFDKLKAANSGRERPFFITDQIPEAWAERKRFIRHLKQQNMKLPQQQQMKTKVQNNEIHFDDIKYEPPVSAPTVKQFLRLSMERKRVIRQLQVFKGEVEEHSESLFTGYTAQVFSLKQVEDYYYHVKLLEPEATHIMCAFKLPGVNFTQVQGAIDDGEYGGGLVLLELLLKQKMVNQAVFVARHYGGKHLGPQRFNIIEKAAESAFKAMRVYQESIRRPPTQEEIQQAVNQMSTSIQQEQWAETTDDENFSQDGFESQDSQE